MKMHGCMCVSDCKLQMIFGGWFTKSTPTHISFVRGAQVDPKFLKKASRDEIFVYWNGQEIPVQCKAKKPGAGRLIPRTSFETLAGSIARDTKIAGKQLLIQIGSTGSIRHHDIEFIRNEVSKGVGFSFGPALISNAGRTFSLKTTALSGTFTKSSVTEYLSQFEFNERMVIGEPIPGTEEFKVDCVIGIEATPNDTHRNWNSLLQSIKRGAKQLENGPPGIVAIHYTDPISDFELFRPGQKSMLMEMSELQHKWPHVGGVMLSTEPDLQLPGSHGSGQSSFYVKEAVLPGDFLGTAV